MKSIDAQSCRALKSRGSRTSRIIVIRTSSNGLPNQEAVPRILFCAQRNTPIFICDSPAVNRADLPFRLLTGLVDCDRFRDVGVLFPAVWMNPEFEGIVPRGTPVAQCFPVAREALDLVCEAFSAEDVQRYRDTARELLSEPSVYRKKFRVKRSSSTAERAT